LVCAAVIVIALSGCRESTGAGEDVIEVTCGVQLGIDAAKASRKDWSGEQRGWSAEASGDTLYVVRKGQCGDECTYADELVFARLGDPCPQLLRASMTRHDAGSPVPAPKATHAQRGVLEIQDWDLAGGVVSGRLVAEFSLTFYATIAPEPR